MRSVLLLSVGFEGFVYYLPHRVYRKCRSLVALICRTRAARQLDSVRLGVSLPWRPVRADAEVLSWRCRCPVSFRPWCHFGPAPSPGISCSVAIEAALLSYSMPSLVVGVLLVGGSVDVVGVVVAGG